MCVCVCVCVHMFVCVCVCVHACVCVFVLSVDADKQNVWALGHLEWLDVIHCATLNGCTHFNYVYIDSRDR